MIFCPVEGFFELHSIATEGKKDEKRAEKRNFLANGESLNHFTVYIVGETSLKVAQMTSILVTIDGDGPFSLVFSV